LSQALWVCLGKPIAQCQSDAEEVEAALNNQDSEQGMA
jgi:hypothetical protein